MCNTTTRIIAKTHNTVNTLFIVVNKEGKTPNSKGQTILITHTPQKLEGNGKKDTMEFAYI